MPFDVEPIALDPSEFSQPNKERFPLKLLKVGYGFKVTDPKDFARCRIAVRRYNAKHGCNIQYVLRENVLYVTLLGNEQPIVTSSGPTRQQMQAYVTTLTVGIPVTLAGANLRHCFDDYYSWIDELNSDPTRPTFDAEETESGTFTVTKLR